MKQLDLASIRNEACPYADFIDDDDLHCNNNGLAPTGYVPLGEDSSDHDEQIASVGGPYLNDIEAVEQNIPELPDYIPVITHGSRKLFVDHEPEWVGVQLGEVLSGTKLRTAKDVRKRLGVPTSTKVVLLAYGLDFLIENLWQYRREKLRELAKLGFDLVTAVNYSIWDMHPHPEKIFNVKRSLVTYQEFQEFGVPAVPHIYWYGQKSMDHWISWLNHNPCIQTIAIDVQTIPHNAWGAFLGELKEFVKLVARRLHFLITGPETAQRILQLKAALPSMTLTNTYASIMAWSRKTLELVDDHVKNEFSDSHKSKIMLNNIQVYEQIMSPFHS